MRNLIVKVLVIGSRAKDAAVKLAHRRVVIPYPVGWVAVCAFALFLAPSLFSAEAHYSFKGPVTLGITGIVSTDISYQFDDGVLPAQKEAPRLETYGARRAAKVARRSGGLHIEIADERLALNPLPFSKTIDRVAREHGVSPALAAAVIKVESGFKPRAHSKRGARGLMQLLPATARRLGVRGNLYKPENNLRAGVRYLKAMLDHYGGDERLAVAAYNAGPGAVDKYGSVPPYRETKAYVPRVLEYSREYSKYFRDI